MSNYQTTQYNHKRNCLSVIGDIFSQAKCFHLPHEKILEMRKEKLFNSYSWKKLRGYQQEYIRGYLDCKFVQFYDYLIWGWNIEGKFYSKYQQVPEKYRKQICNETIKGHHWYKEATNKSFS